MPLFNRRETRKKSEFMLLGLCTADSAQPEVAHGNITVLQHALRQEVEPRA